MYLDNMIGYENVDFFEEPDGGFCNTGYVVFGDCDYGFGVDFCVGVDYGTRVGFGN